MLTVVPKKFKDIFTPLPPEEVEKRLRDAEEEIIACVVEDLKKMIATYWG